MFSEFEENNYCTIAGSGSRFFTSDNLCSLPCSRFWGGALRDDTKNGCEGDYNLWGGN